MQEAAQPDLKALPGPTAAAESTFGKRADASLMRKTLIEIALEICDYYRIEFDNPIVQPRAMQAARCRKWAMIQMFDQEKRVHVAMQSREDSKTYEDAVSVRLSGVMADSRPIEESIDRLLQRGATAEADLKEFARATQAKMDRRPPLPRQRVGGAVAQ